MIGPTLVVAVKENCDGCRAFYVEGPTPFEGVEVVLIARQSVGGEWLDDARVEVVEAPELFNALEIRSAPFYVAIDVDPVRVVGEGIAFDPAQVAEEIVHLFA